MRKSKFLTYSRCRKNEFVGFVHRKNAYTLKFVQCMKHYACDSPSPSNLFLVGVVALDVPGCGTEGTPFFAGWNELVRGSILLLGMFL